MLVSFLSKGRDPISIIANVEKLGTFLGHEERMDNIGIYILYVHLQGVYQLPIRVPFTGGTFARC